jgi:hypothetical protein
MVPVAAFALALAPLLSSEPPPVDLADWTPRPATGQVEPWETKRDPAWDDTRFRQMDTGPTLNASIRVPGGRLVTRGTAVKLGAAGTLVIDRGTGQVVGQWSGPLKLSVKRFGLMNTPTPEGKPLFVNAGVNSTLPTAHFHALDLTADGVAWSYTPPGGAKRLGRVTTTGGQVTVTDTPFAAEPPPAGPRWGAPIVTPLKRGEAKGAFAIDTLTIPTENRFKALFFCAGVDVLPDGRVAVCTAHGDVWLVTVDEKAGTCAWQRFATGLYQPLGLKVVDGAIHVIERGQLTKLVDRNGDGEADSYECVCNQWHCGGGEHSYDTCLETDPAGNFYFQHTGDTFLPDGGCVMKVSPGGATCSVLSTGTRHPIGLGVSPTGVVTGADQEGNWMPATRIDIYKSGGFTGDMRAHHRSTPPATYDPPLCWLPRETDNSAGGQVWVPEKTFGPLAGKPLHLSYGRCKAFALLIDDTHAVPQAGVWDLGLNFLSGVCRGRFTKAGDLIVCGLNGWQTAAQADGCLQRVRYTDQPMNATVGLKVSPQTLDVTFSDRLDPASVANLADYRAEAWNYRWTGDYGSKRYRPSDANAVGQDVWPVTAATLQPDGKTVRLTLPALRPVMQLQLGVNLKSAAGDPVRGLVTLTVNGVK